MKFTKVIISLICMVFASFNAFAEDEIIIFNLTDGDLSVGEPTSFVLNRTKQVFCTDKNCTATISKLTTLPDSSKGTYVGSAIDGLFPLVDKDGNLLMSKDLLQYNLKAGGEYNVKNLFWRNTSITLFSKESTLTIKPTAITLTSLTEGWLNKDNNEPITQMITLPTMSEKVFVGFGTSPDLTSFRVIDRDGKILSQAATLADSIEMYSLWKSVRMCSPGTYLPAYTEECVTCPENYWCPGEKIFFETNYYEDQGINACTFGLISKLGSSTIDDCYTPGTDMAVCEPGWYLPGYATECAICKTGSWCEGGVYSLKIAGSGADQGINTCPSEGKSAEKATDISECYMAEISTIIEHGTANQTCYYGVIGYTESCELNYVTTCDGGYYVTEEFRSNDCIPVGYGYYSPEKETKRTACPGTVNIPDIKTQTETETSSDISQCYIPSVPYSIGSDTINGIGTMDCFYSLDTRNYGSAEILSYDPLKLPIMKTTVNCINKQVVYCFGGYYLENEDKEECIGVGNGYYSPRPAFSDLNAGCFDKTSSIVCPYTVDITDYQSARGRETCPTDYENSQLPRTKNTDCYKECKLDVANASTVTPLESLIFYQEPIIEDRIEESKLSEITALIIPVCTFNVECNDGYTVIDNDTRSPSCILDDSCTPDPNASESDENCIPTKCKEGYHIEDKQCASNIATCPIENGIGRKEWMGDNMLGGKWTMCTAYKCNPGYTSKRYLTNETEEPCGECRNRRDTSGNIAVSAWKDDDCVIATCMYQGELYRLDSTGNKCVQICDTAGREDATGTMLWNPLTEKCERTCNSGFTSW